MGTADEPPFDSVMRDPVPMTDAEWEPFARATGIESPSKAGWWIVPFAVLGTGAWVGIALLVRWAIRR